LVAANHNCVISAEPVDVATTNGSTDGVLEPASMTDGELVRRALDGDAAAYDQLARRWAARVLAVCHARVKRREFASDLAQESLLRALQNLHTLQDPEKFGPWVRGIATNVCKDWFRSPAARDLTLPPGHDGILRWLRIDDEPVGHWLEEVEERHRLLSAIYALPDDLREAIMLHYYDDMTYDELANVLGVSKATVNARLANAREALRRLLTPATR
jgi:RNA polymerase sigma factor (sigma-70 family)